MSLRLQVWFALAVFLVLALGLAHPAAAQVTNADVERHCQAKQPLPAADWSRTWRHTGYAVTAMEAKNPFPGRERGDVWVEVFGTFHATFSCELVDPQGAPSGASVEVAIDDRPATVDLFDLQACAAQAGGSKLLVVYVGADCPYRQDAGFNTGTSTAPGPYSYSVEPLGASCTVFRPTVLGEDGLRHPIMIWGNGTGGKPTNYPSPPRLASHGFVVVAANTPMSGTGREMTACLDAIMAEASNPASLYWRRLNTHRVGVMGYSQGGGGALMAGRDGRVGATVLLNPYVGAQNGSQMSAANLQHAPMMLVSGGKDTVAPVSNQRELFRRLTSPVFYLTVRNAGHDLTAYHIAGGVAFARWVLMGAPEMTPVFEGPACSLCLDPAVTVQKKALY